MGSTLRGAIEGERGIALVMVLWIFMALTVLVGEFSRSMRDDAVAAHNLAEETQARGVAVAGMNQALYRTLRDREEKKEDEAAVEETEPWEPDGTWHDGAYGGGKFSVRMIDEGGKIALNRADETLLRRVFTNLGLDLDAQEEVVDAILDWRDSDAMHRLHGAEADYYLRLPEPYRPKDGPFDSVDELLQVRGISRDLYYGRPASDLEPGDTPPIALKDVFSVFGRSANINIRNAPEAVLRVLLGEEEEVTVQEIMAARKGDRGTALNLARGKVGDGLLARRLVDTSANTIAVDVRAVMELGTVQARLGAVVDIAEDADGFHVVRWFDRLPVL